MNALIDPNLPAPSSPSIPHATKDDDDDELTKPSIGGAGHFSYKDKLMMRALLWAAIHSLSIEDYKRAVHEVAECVEIMKRK